METPEIKRFRHHIAEGMTIETRDGLLIEVKPFDPAEGGATSGPPQPDAVPPIAEFARRFGPWSLKVTRKST